MWPHPAFDVSAGESEGSPGACIACGYPPPKHHVFFLILIIGPVRLLVHLTLFCLLYIACLTILMVLLQEEQTAWCEPQLSRFCYTKALA